MKSIFTGYILDPSIQQPFTGPSLDFLQGNTKDLAVAFAKGQLQKAGLSYSLTTPYNIYNNNLISNPFFDYRGNWITNNEWVIANNQATITASSGGTLTIDAGFIANQVYNVTVDVDSLTGTLTVINGSTNHVINSTGRFSFNLTADTVDKNLSLSASTTNNATLNMVTATLLNDKSWVLYNEDVYQLNTIAYDDKIAVLTQSFDSIADPLEFTDGVFRSVHINYTLTASTSTIGGLFNLSGLTYVNNVDEWHYVGNSGEPAFSAYFSASTTGLKFKKTSDKTCRISGVITALSNLLGNNLIFQLPEGYYNRNEIKCLTITKSSGANVFNLRTNIQINAYSPIHAADAGKIFLVESASTGDEFYIDLEFSII